MQSLSILIAQMDDRTGDLLAANLRTHFREIRRVQGVNELWEGFSSNEEPYAIIVDLALIDFQRLQEICQRFRNTAVICTHRLADDEMWTAALAAGAADCCIPNDITSILRAASSTHLRTLPSKAA